MSSGSGNATGSGPPMSDSGAAPTMNPTATTARSSPQTAAPVTEEASNPQSTTATPSATESADPSANTSNPSGDAAAAVSDTNATTTTTTTTTELTSDILSSAGLFGVETTPAFKILEYMKTRRELSQDKVIELKNRLHSLHSVLLRSLEAEKTSLKKMNQLNGT